MLERSASYSANDMEYARGLRAMRRASNMGNEIQVEREQSEEAGVKHLQLVEIT